MGTERTVTDAEVDQHLDAVLRAAGSALRNYSMAPIKDAMRDAMRQAMAAAIPAAPVGVEAAGHVAMLRSLRLMYDDGLMQADDHLGTVAALDAAIAALSQQPAPAAPVGVGEADIDVMRDVYLSSHQREAYDRILAAALAGAP